MSITAIVPVWNGCALLRRLMGSLERQTRRAGEILAIDNGSTDGAPVLARALGARVVEMGRNAGFAAAVNRGIMEARGDWLAILNSDVELAPDYFEKLAATGAPFATGKILSPSGMLDATFDLTTRGAATWRAGNGMPDAPPFDIPRDIASAPWTAALFRREVFSRAGLLEEAFESYLEDADFGLRCASLGIHGRYVPEARAVHLGSASLGAWHPETVRRIARNQVFLAARHPAAGRPWPALVAQALWCAVAIRHGTGFAALRGKCEGLRRFAAVRRHAPSSDAEALEPILRSHEQFIRKTSAETYWRLYFLLTGGAK
jgi:GT2 family glycosyltransferase